ncbi:MAG TPA: DEAD/DEAH box helicase [Propionibacteriaceae bacterium]|nr:DEAD/DEAH box helicase [Propionibacteriaceae bacterium]
MDDHTTSAATPDPHEPPAVRRPVADFPVEFAAGYSFPLDSYQIEACEEVAAGHGVLVAAPTGAGKTVVGEYAVWSAVRSARKCFYTTPIKALSNQKYHDLVERYGADRVGLLTGDNSVNGDAQIVVMTTEVLRNMIYAGSHTLANLGYVVMDEVHYLADRFRGAVWEEVIIGLAPDVQLVCLSATVSNAEEFGEWLNEVRGDVTVVVSERRPVPLFQHVLVGRDLVDLFAGEAPTARALPSDTPPPVNPKLVRLATQESRLVRDSSRRPRGASGKGKRTVAYGSGRYGGASSRTHQERAGNELGTRPASRAQMIDQLERARLLPVIVFVFSRQGCDGAVGQVMGSRVRLTSRAEQAKILEIAARHLGGLSPADHDALDLDRFLDALGRGVAAHHAGVLPACKAAIEETFAAGLLKVVFATETLALGINMPARTVVLEKLVKYNGETHADITPGEYTQLTGRAGRRGIDVEGHAVVVWQPGMDPRAVAGLASRRTYPLRSSFAPTYNMAVNMVSRVGRHQARRLLEQSFAQFQTDRSVVGLARTVDRNTDAIRQYLDAATCDLGDFADYARMREEANQLEAEMARLRKADRRAEAFDAVTRLEPGDIVHVPAGRHRGWAAVLDLGNGRDPHPFVVTEARDFVRLTLDAFPVPVAPVARLRIPHKFDPRQPAARRALAASLIAKLEALDPSVLRPDKGPTDADLSERIEELRARIRAHPCHHCPDRETHARFAERAMRLERETSQTVAKAEARTNTIAKRFDRLCGVLESLGYLESDAGRRDDELRVTAAGKTLSRIYSQLDLVTAECVRDGVFDGLSHPQLAAVISSLVYESRRTDAGRPARMPDRGSEQAQQRLRDTWRRVGLVERDFRVERAPAPDIGFAEAAFGWASGWSLAVVLDQSGLSAGDFVRWVRQVIDFAGQIADAVGPGDLRRTAREVVVAMRRGVIEYDIDED